MTAVSSFHRSLKAMLGLAAAAALLFALPSFIGAPPVHGQVGAPVGNQPCPDTIPVAGQGCSVANQTCPDGSVLYAGQVCNNVGFAFCPGGGASVAGAPCPFNPPGPYPSGGTSAPAAPAGQYSQTITSTGVYCVPANGGATGPGGSPSGGGC